MALDFLGLFDLIPTKVEFYNHIDGAYESVCLINENELESSFMHDLEVTDEITDEQLDNVHLLLYIKDKFQISDKAWHELAMKSKDLPTSYGIKKRIQELNAQWNVFPTPGSAEGVQMKLKDSLTEQVTRLLKEGKLHNFDSLKIKLSGDGTRVGKHLQLLNVTYTIINEGNVAMSEKGNYVIAVIKTKDDYESIRESVAELREEMRNLNEITVNQKTFNIEYFLGGDWKFLATVCGIGQANQDYACIWCLCPKSLRHDISKSWSLTNTADGARTIDLIKQHARAKKYNCRNVPLFDFIPLDHVIIDTLHLFLRISDILIELLIRQLRKEDALEKKDTFIGGFNRAKYRHMDSYQKFLNSIGIAFEWMVDKDTKKLQYRDLTGPEKLLVFQKIKIKELLPNFPDSEKVENLWFGFIDIYGKLKLDHNSNDEIERFSREAIKWTEEFLYLYQASDVTPYMHAFRVHVPEFLQLYKNIANFNQQGLEKYNDQASKDYFRSTNHRNIESLRQLMLKKSRIQYLEARGAQRAKNSYLCSNCKENGHIIKKCTSKCSSCDVNVCCTHLCKRGNKWIKRYLEDQPSLD